MLDILVPWVVLFGLIGLAGLAGFKHPVATGRRGVGTGLLGLTGFCGISIPTAGAIDAYGAFGLWKHQNPRFAFRGKLAWLFVAALPCRWRLFGG